MYRSVKTDRNFWGLGLGPILNKTLFKLPPTGVNTFGQTPITTGVHHEANATPPPARKADVPNEPMDTSGQQTLANSKKDILEKTDQYQYESDDGSASEPDGSKMSVLSREFFGKEDKAEMELKIKELQAQINAVTNEVEVKQF